MNKATTGGRPTRDPASGLGTRTRSLFTGGASDYRLFIEQEHEQQQPETLTRASGHQMHISQSFGTASTLFGATSKKSSSSDSDSSSSPYISSNESSPTLSWSDPSSSEAEMRRPFLARLRGRRGDGYGDEDQDMNAVAAAGSRRRALGWLVSLGLWTLAVAFCWLVFFAPPRAGWPATLRGAGSRSKEEEASVVPHQNRVTIVSGFYKIDTVKKHTVDQYNTWMGNFLGHVELPVIFYCAPSEEERVRSLRGDKPITVVTTWETPFEMPPLQDLGGIDWAHHQYEKDPEPQHHVPEVYGIWTAKPWIVKRAKDMNPYASEYFFWADAGAFRESGVSHTFAGLEMRLDEIYGIEGHRLRPDDMIILASVQAFAPGLDFVKGAKRLDEPARDSIIQAGWYGGKAQGIDWWAREVQKIVILQAGLGRFAGKEQPIWTHTARMNWEKIFVQNVGQAQGLDCGPDMWFTFEYFADGRDCSVPFWDGPAYAKAASASISSGRPGRVIAKNLR